MDVVALQLLRQLRQIDQRNNYHLFLKAGPDTSGISNSANLRIHEVPGLTYADWEQIFLPAALRKIKPDLLHCTANTAPVKCSVPMVLTLHDIIFMNADFKGSAYQNTGNLYRKWILPYAIRQARTIITVSHAEKKKIVEELSVDPARIEVIHHAASETFHDKYQQDDLIKFRSKYQLPGQFILHLGNTAPKKNTARVIQAYIEYCSMSADPMPIVIADYPRPLANKIIAEENRPELLKLVHTPGYIPVSEMPLLYNSASLFLYPSLQESFGLPLLEVMACGVPVIASAIPALQEVGNDAALFTDPLSVQHLANTILGMFEHTALMDAYKKKGLARASQFSWKRSAEQLLKIYER